MYTSPPFPIFYLIGLGQTLGAILDQPLEKAIASSPTCVVTATRDESGFEITQTEPGEAKAAGPVQTSALPQG